MKVKKKNTPNKTKVLCPHCFNYFSGHKIYSREFVYGDGDGARYHPEWPCRVEDSCPKCGEDVFVIMHIPEYVVGVPQDNFDLYTYLNKYDAISEFVKKFKHSVGDTFSNEIIKKILTAKTLKDALSVSGIQKLEKKFFQWLYLLSHPRK